MTFTLFAIKSSYFLLQFLESSQQLLILLKHSFLLIFQNCYFCPLYVDGLSEVLGLLSAETVIDLPILVDYALLDIFELSRVCNSHELQLFPQQFVVTPNLEDSFGDALHEFEIVDPHEAFQDVGDHFLRCYRLQLARKVVLHAVNLKGLQLPFDVLLFLHLFKINNIPCQRRIPKGQDSTASKGKLSEDPPLPYNL